MNEKNYEQIADEILELDEQVQMLDSKVKWPTLICWVTSFICLYLLLNLEWFFNHRLVGLLLISIPAILMVYCFSLCYKRWRLMRKVINLSELLPDDEE